VTTGPCCNVLSLFHECDIKRTHDPSAAFSRTRSCWWRRAWLEWFVGGYKTLQATKVGNELNDWPEIIRARTSSFNALGLKLGRQHVTADGLGFVPRHACFYWRAKKTANLRRKAAELQYVSVIAERHCCWSRYNFYYWSWSSISSRAKIRKHVHQIPVVLSLQTYRTGWDSLQALFAQFSSLSLELDIE